MIINIKCLMIKEKLKNNNLHLKKNQAVVVVKQIIKL